ncbi:MAG: serine/threonine protein kinase, partial [Myxococcales bacterium]|nr:serine/threonine protein kinase [Myxococcales bacterium]
DTTLTTLARFRREAEIASTLAHPHIVEVFDYQVAENGAPYLVMELLEGEDLADRLKRGRIGIVAALRIIAEIAEALDVAHTGGVVHRDLKPANIFLCKRGPREDFVKVLDFGVSKLIDSATLTQEKAMVGTPLYMSPEQAIGTQELTPESDIFSLGAISWEMLTGRRAFAASSIPSILYQIVHGATPKLAGKAPGLSTAADEVFARVLAKKKDDRYRRATQFAEDLRIALGREEPGDLAARTIAFDGDGLEALSLAPESPSDVIRNAAMVDGADVAADARHHEAAEGSAHAVSGGGARPSRRRGIHALVHRSAQAAQPLDVARDWLFARGRRHRRRGRAGQFDDGQAGRPGGGQPGDDTVGDGGAEAARDAAAARQGVARRGRGEERHRG